MTLTECFTGIANAIREKKKTTDLLTPGQMAAEIRGIESGSLFQSIVTDVIANHIVSATNFAPGGSLEEFPPTTLSGAKCYYNGVLLPGIPAEVLDRYPYAWIRKNLTTGYYDVVFSALQPWYDQTGPGVRYGTRIGTATCYQILISSAEDATEWTFNGTKDTWFGLDDNRTILWSNNNIPNGSATATEIYFEGSEPAPAE